MGYAFAPFCLIPYSGKVSHGANSRGWVGYRENQNIESLNVCTRVITTQRRREN